MAAEADFSRYEGFEWDKSNADKIWRGHEVSPFECEQVFFNQPLVVAPDEAHSSVEPRFYVLGRTDADRRLFLVFTVRRGLIRVVSALFPFKATLQALDAALNGAGGLGGALLHLAALFAGFGLLGRLALTRFA